MPANPVEPILPQHFCVISSHHIAEVRKNTETGQKSLVSLQDYAPGDVLHSFHAGVVLRKPTYLTVQVNETEHITLQPDFLQYINHSCRPNTFFDTTKMQLVALRPIDAGEEITFFYPSTEWDMSQPFQCHCHQPECIGQIKGAAWLSEAVVRRYRFTDFINRQFQKRMQEARA